MSVVCAWCGTSFERPQTSKRRFCSRHCGAMWRVSAGFSKGRVKEPDKWGTLTCPVCGREFEYKLSDPPRRCCSRSCAALLRMRENRHPLQGRQRDASKYSTTICPTCGKEFEYLLSWPRKYCSNVCAGKANVTNIASFTPTGYDATCEICGKTFRANKTVRGRFCSLKCFGKWQSLYIRGMWHPLRWHKFGRHARFPPTFLHCRQCGKSYIVKPSWATSSRFCSRKCLSKYQSLTWVGENNPAWEGGYDSYYGPTWRLAQRLTRERDKVCQRCGKSPEQLGKQLDVHHIKPFRTFGRERHAEANTLSNLVALCHSCHLAWEWATKGRRGVSRKRRH